MADHSMHVDQASDSRSLLWIPLACMWILMILTFSAPGREGPSTLNTLDTIAIAKVLSRGLVLIVLLGTLGSLWSSPRRVPVVQAILPLGVFVLWAILSAVWSPLRAVSVGQVSGLVVLVVLVAVIGIAWTGPVDTERILRHVAMALLCLSASLLFVDLFVSHDLSGLNRDLFSDVEGASGLVHPTTAGATASLGLVVVTASRLIWNWRWSRVLMVPAVLVHLPVLLLAASRTAVGLAIVIALLIVVIHANRVALAGVILAMSVAGTVYLAIDPRLDLVETATGGAVAYARRGESMDQISSFTGRTELWTVILQSFTDAPLIGHGYFVTSKTGVIDVWSGPANRTAHNLFLQVLVSTGLIGALLFVYGLGRAILGGFRGLTDAADDLRLAGYLLLVGLWYAGWGLFSESFMGPVEPESVLFFVTLGLLIGQVPAPSTMTVRGRPERVSVMAEAH